MAEKNSTNAVVNTHGDDNVPLGMLSSPHIAYCVEKYKIIDGFEQSCLGPSTYHMRIGGKVRTWEDGKLVEYTLGHQSDLNKNIRNKVELRPNSLTFVTTIEKFCLTRDIIARFNLKSKLVHKGLLLGTGPIVDPELHGNLLIPLHNFSSQTVTLGFNDKIISVEFTKTLNPDDHLCGENGIFKYIPNDNWNFSPDKYWADQLGSIMIESSVSSSFDKYEKSFSEYRSAFVTFNWIAGLTAAGAIIGMVVLVFTTWSIIDKARDNLKESTNILRSSSDANNNLSIYALKSTVKDLQEKVSRLEEQNKDVYEEWLLRPGRSTKYSPHKPDSKSEN